MKSLGMRNKQKGQVLLIVLVISTLTLMLLIGVASRISTGQRNIRRSTEFDKAFASSENALNEIIRSVSNAECEPQTEEFELVKCDWLDELLGEGNQFEVFGRIKGKAAPISLNSPLSLLISDKNDSAVAATGVEIDCSEIALDPDQKSQLRFSVSLVHFGPNFNNPTKSESQLLNAKFGCGATQLSSCGDNVQFYKYNGTAKSAAEVVNNMQLVRVRVLDNNVLAPDTNINIKVSLLNQNPSSRACATVAQTGNLEYMVLGLGGLGSDNIVKFEKARGDYNYIPSIFDYVFFGEDI